MPNVQYGNTIIEYRIQEKNHLSAHYISVDRVEGVVLQGKLVDKTYADQLILKKATWILDKLALVKVQNENTEIVTGARILYLGRRYYVELRIDEALKVIQISFTASKFKIVLPSQLNTQEDLVEAFNVFFQIKAKEKITPRVKKLIKETGYVFNELKFRKLEKRWGSCTSANNIIINYEAVRLPYSLIDYLIVHELVHTKIKNHSKAFWAELAKHKPNWKELDERVMHIKL